MKTKYYAIHIEFQVCGSLHVHCFLWVVNAPVLTSNNKEDYVAFLPEKKEIPKHLENIKMKLVDLNLERFSVKKH